MCSSISQAAKYAKVDDKTFRLIKSLNEGQYTFLLKSLPELPRKIQTNRKTVGIRIAGIEVVVKILEELDEPILSTSLLEPTPEEVRNGITVHHGFSKGLNLKSFSYGWDAKEALDNQIEICLEIGQISADPSTVLDLTEGLKIIREGAGSIEGLEEDE